MLNYAHFRASFSVILQYFVSKISILGGTAQTPTLSQALAITTNNYPTTDVDGCTDTASWLTSSSQRNKESEPMTLLSCMYARCQQD